MKIRPPSKGIVLFTLLIACLVFALWFVVYPRNKVTTYSRGFVGDGPVLGGCFDTCEGEEIALGCKEEGNFTPSMKTCTYECHGIHRNSCQR